MSNEIKMQTLVMSDVKFEANNLKSKAITLANDLNRLVKRIDEYQKTGDISLVRRINGLGEVQGQGNSIDASCASIRALLLALDHAEAIERLSNKWKYYMVNQEQWKKLTYKEK